MTWLIIIAALALGAFVYFKYREQSGDSDTRYDRDDNRHDDRGQPKREEPKPPKKGGATYERVTNPRSIRIGDTLTLNDDDIAPIVGTVDRIEELTDAEDSEDVWWSFRLQVLGDNGMITRWLNCEYDDDDRLEWSESEQLDDITAQRVLGKKVSWEDGPPLKLTHDGIEYTPEEDAEDCIHYDCNARDWHADRPDVSYWKVRCSDYKSTYDTYLCVEVWKDGRGSRTCVSITKQPVRTIRRLRQAA